MNAIRPHRAFTLVELLVTLGVIAILLAITLPALSGARVSAGRAMMLSNLRGVGVSFETYLQAFDGVYPFHRTDEPYQASPPGEVGLTVVTSDPWAMMTNWPSVFHAVAPWREHYRSWLNNGRDVDESRPWMGDPSRGLSGIVSYWYCCSFMARPETWAGDPQTVADPSELLMPTRGAEIASPSAKALCIDMDRAYLRRVARPEDGRGVLLVDGSAAVRLDAHASPPVQNRVNDRPPRPYFDTPRGIRGRDIQ